MKDGKNHLWKTEVDQALPAQWAAMLDLFEDANLYQTASYGAIRWGERNLSRLVLKRDGETVAMAQFRIIRPTPLKFGIAYLRWGPLWERKGFDFDSEVAERMAQEIEDEYVRRRRLFVRIIPNAFEESSRAAAMKAGFSKFKAEALDYHYQYRTLVLDLRPSIEELRSRLDKKWRNQLARAEKNNLKVICGTGDDIYQTFCGIYNEMRARKRFETTVDVEEFGRIQRDLHENSRMQILICEDAGIPVAGLVASAMGNSAIYVLGATSDHGLQSKGAYLLHWSLISRLKQMGVTTYDLGGIDPDGNPGVYHFKKGFSGADVRHINPLVASKNAMSSGLARATLTVQRSIRSFYARLNVAQSLKQLAKKL